MHQFQLPFCLRILLCERSVKGTYLGFRTSDFGTFGAWRQPLALLKNMQLLSCRFVEQSHCISLVLKIATANLPWSKPLSLTILTVEVLAAMCRHASTEEKTFAPQMRELSTIWQNMHYIYIYKGSTHVAICRKLYTNESNLNTHINIQWYLVGRFPQHFLSCINKAFITQDWRAVQRFCARIIFLVLVRKAAKDNSWSLKHLKAAVCCGCGRMHKVYTPQGSL